eukprot:357811-Chlamydomonas_euryale.AAC.9
MPSSFGSPLTALASVDVRGIEAVEEVQTNGAGVWHRGEGSGQRRGDEGDKGDSRLSPTRRPTHCISHHAQARRIM